MIKPQVYPFQTAMLFWYVTLFFSFFFTVILNNKTLIKIN